MTKRSQQDSGEERVAAMSKPMMNLVSRCSKSTPDVLPSNQNVDVFSDGSICVHGEELPEKIPIPSKYRRSQ